MSESVCQRWLKEDERTISCNKTYKNYEYL